jgi:adenylosuccinate synthase
MNKELKKLVKGKQIVAVVCNQWGDTGKGKFSDYFSAYWADVVARGTGGNNAGHTVILNGKEKIFHLLPSGITYDSKGKVNILGNGMVLDLKVLLQELDALEKDGLSYKNLMISKDANGIMPYHIARDLAKNKSQAKGGIGTTGRGIGPCYADKIARVGIRIADLYDKEMLIKRLLKAKEIYPEQDIDIKFLVDRLKPYVERIKPFVKDTVGEIHNFVRQGKKILLEGAQGLLLSVEHGTYPYVTSSDAGFNGTAAGVGLSGNQVDLVLGVVKFPFMTRVGAGPFPTELGGPASEKYCAEEGHRKSDELKKYGITFNQEGEAIKYDCKDKKISELMNSKDPFLQGVGVRLAAGEYGATTGRPRRIGWTDAVAARYAVGINGPNIILSKLDCIFDINHFKLCFGYKHKGKIIKDFQKDETFLRQVLPIYKKYKGYGDLKKIKSYASLPVSLKTAIKDFEKFTGGKVVALSTGADKDSLIVR